MKRRVLSLLLALTLSLSLLSATVAAAEGFRDVPTDAWFYNDVQTACHLGLIEGKEGNRFGPDDPLTLAESITLTVRLHQQLIEKEPVDEAGPDLPWYVPYVEYADRHDLIPEGIDRSDYDRKATRREYMAMFYQVLKELPKQTENYVPDGSIPDVSSQDKDAEAIYGLYRAGIVQGKDSIGTCEPDSNIIRSEVAAILVRMAQPEERRRFTLMPQGQTQLTMEELRAHQKEQGALAGVAFLGNTEDLTDFMLHSSQVESYLPLLPFLKDINSTEWMVQPGNEVYCILPTDPQATIQVYDYVFDETNDYQGAAGQLLYQKKGGGPIVVQCNVSDIFPGVIITITDSQGRTVEYSPTLSLNNGFVSTSYGNEIHDWTMYDN